MGYSFRFLKPHHPYLPAWVEYHRRKQRCLKCGLTFLAAFAVAGLAMCTLFAVMPQGQPPAPWAVLALPACLAAGLSILVVFVAGVGHTIFFLHFLAVRCPRCGSTFSKSWYWRGFVTRCLHCGLDEYAPCDPAEQEWEFESQITPKNDERAPS